MSASVCSVKQAQGSHAACIMLSSFVTYDKRSCTGHKVQFFKTLFFCGFFFLTTHRKSAFSKSSALWKLPCVAFNVLIVRHLTVSNFVTLRRTEIDISIILEAVTLLKNIDGQQKGLLIYQGIKHKPVFVSAHIRLMKDGLLDLCAHQGETAG